MYHIMVQIYLHGVFGIWESVDGKFDHHCIALHCAKPEVQRAPTGGPAKRTPWLLVQKIPGPNHVKVLNSWSKPCSGYTFFLSTFMSRGQALPLSPISGDFEKPVAIHPKSESPDSANYFHFPQNYSLRTRKLPTLLWWILSQRTKALKMCQSVLKKCDLRNIFAKFWCWDWRTFPAIFCQWKADFVTVLLLECMPVAARDTPDTRFA